MARPTRPRSKTQISGQQLANYSSGRAALTESLLMKKSPEARKVEGAVVYVDDPSESEIEFKEKVLGNLSK